MGLQSVYQGEVGVGGRHVNNTRRIMVPQRACVSGLWAFSLRGIEGLTQPGARHGSPRAPPARRGSRGSATERLEPAQPGSERLACTRGYARNRFLAPQLPPTALKQCGGSRASVQPIETRSRPSSPHQLTNLALGNMECFKVVSRLLHTKITNSATFS